MTERIRWFCPGCGKAYAVPSTEGLTLCPSCTQPDRNLQQPEREAAANSEDRFTFNCAACMTTLSAKPSHIGKRIQCPKCSKSIVVERARFPTINHGHNNHSNREPQPHPNAIHAAAPELPDRFDFRCPKCNVPLNAKLKSVGKSQKCPNCSEKFVVECPENLRSKLEPEKNSETLRVLGSLVYRAVNLVHRTSNIDWEAAVLCNCIFIVLPTDEQAARINEPRHSAINHALKICHEVRELVRTNGSRFLSEWDRSLIGLNWTPPERIPRQRRDTRFRYRASQATFETVVSSTYSRRRWSIKVRIRIWERHDKKCYYCGRALQSWRGKFMHLDHHHPLVAGGIDEESNLVPACPDCNLEKGVQILPESSPA